MNIPVPILQADGRHAFRRSRSPSSDRSVVELFPPERMESMTVLTRDRLSPSFHRSFLHRHRPRAPLYFAHRSFSLTSWSFPYCCDGDMVGSDIAQRKRWTSCDGISCGAKRALLLSDQVWSPCQTFRFRSAACQGYRTPLEQHTMHTKDVPSRACRNPYVEPPGTRGCCYSYNHR